MQSSKKLVLRKSNLKSLTAAEEFKKAVSDGTASSITELDISHNLIR